MQFVPRLAQFVARPWQLIAVLPKMQAMNSTCTGRTTMNAKHLILTLSLAFAVNAGASEPGRVEPSGATGASAGTSVAIPRVVVTASRAQARAIAQSAETPIARVVVTAPRQTAAGTGGPLPRSAVGRRL